EKTPAATRGFAEKMRPITEEASRAGGTANKTNAGVNSKVGTIGTIGKVSAVGTAVVSTYNIATAENKTEAVMKEGTVLTGAIVGGEVGAEVGLAVGGPWGALIGGAAGSIVGAVVGEQVFAPSQSNMDNSNNYDDSGRYLVPQDATGRIKVEEPKLIR